MASPYYPPVCFYFEVKIAGIQAASDASFTEADGLESELGIMEVKEGGENRYSHRLPDRASHGKLTLKRGVTPASSDLAQWCKTTLESDFSAKVTTRNINVSLLDEKRKPAIVWTFFDAWPVKWSLGGLDSQKNEIAVETLEFAYTYSARHK